MLPRKISRAGLTLLALFWIPQAARAGPITFNTALPVAKRTGVFRVQYVLFRAGGDATSLDRSVTVQAVPSVLAVGPTARVTLFAIFPCSTTPFGWTRLSAV